MHLFTVYKWLILLFSNLTPCCSWQYFTQISDLPVSGRFAEDKYIHSEYKYGNCDSIKSLRFYTHQHFTHVEVLGKLILRAWLDIKRIPTCIIIRASSYEEDLMRNTAFGFQVCVPRITYSHSQRRVKYFYLEWYIPDTMDGGMDWDLYFYGPWSEEW